MTFNEISQKLIKGNKKQYGLFFSSVVFSCMMVGAYGVLQYSPTVTNVLIDGGSTQTISQAMFSGSVLGIVVFMIYANSLFLKHKSKEIGIFLSLGIDRSSVQKIVVKEFTILFRIASVIGISLSIPMAFLCWSILNIFLKTKETAFTIGWKGMEITVIFSIVVWGILRQINYRYIKKVKIMQILKSSDENENTLNGSRFRLFVGGALVPVGIIVFFALQNMSGIMTTVFAFFGLIAAALGMYLLVIQLASIGDILKKSKRKAYYKNIVFYNLLKQKIQQYTHSIFVAALLITFTVFSIGFISAGFIDGYNIAIREPCDYMVNTTYEHSDITEQRIHEIAKDSDTKITKIKQMNSLLLGVENVYHNGEKDWSSRIVVSERNFNEMTGENITVPKGSYTFYYDRSMEYKLNAFHSDSSLFYNPTTKEEFRLIQNEPICMKNAFNSRSFFSSFLILNNDDFNELSTELGEEYKVKSFLINVKDWKRTAVLQEKILKAVIQDNNERICVNWHNSAIFDKTGNNAEYLSYEGNETRIARVWTLYPLSKLSSATTQMEAFATYFMLMLFIAIIAFVSAVMVISLKFISTIWDDAVVYDSLYRLGMTGGDIKKLIIKQMGFIYFIPMFLGCIIGAFATYQIMLVSSVTYVRKTMFFVGGVCAGLVILQIVIFMVIAYRIEGINESSIEHF